MKKKICILSALMFSFLCHHVRAGTGTRPTAPVLILGRNNDMSAYTKEILKAEGFRCFVSRPLDSTTRALSGLSDFRLIILPRLTLTVAQQSLLENYVSNGGNLLTFRPASLPARLTGIEIQARPAANSGYLQIGEGGPLTAGFLRQALQYHGAADYARVIHPEATAVIAYYCDAGKSATANPAVVRTRYGKGQTIVFLYDLPQSILLTRQGNPDLTARENDGIKGIRAMDMFTGGWIDTANNTLSQADEQMHLFSRCVESLCSLSGPLPRIWFFPDTLSSLIALTNDGEYQTEKDFAPQFADVASRDARMTLYLLQPEKVSADFADSLVRSGFEIAAHPDATAIAESPTWTGVNQAIARKIELVGKLTGVPRIRTNTNHWFVWCGTDSNGARDFTAGAQIESMNGIRMDVNYAHYDNHAASPRFLGTPGYRQGNFTGSGLPMKFGTMKGGVVDVYQLFNNVYDQQYMENKDQKGYEECFRGLLDRSMNGTAYSYICIRAHNDEYFFSKAPLMRMLSFARQRKIPVWPVSKVLDFVSAKDSVSIEPTVWKGNRLTFLVGGALQGSSSLGVIIPAEFEDGILESVTRDGQPVISTIRKIAGKRYAVLAVVAGRSTKISAVYRSRKNG